VAHKVCTMISDKLSSPTREQAAQQKEAALRPGLAILSIAAIASLSLEIEILDHLDGLSLYMTYREVALDAGVALLGSLSLALAWWLFVLILSIMASFVDPAKGHASSLAWSLWLGVPTAYLSLDLIRAATILFAFQWRPRLTVWLLVGSIITVVSIGALFTVNRSRLQIFCRDRLVPVGWLHIVLGSVAIVALFVNGVYLFHDYARPGKSLAASDLPDVYLITIDALRADDLSLYGYNLPTTPSLEKFSQRSSTFDYFVANTNFTTSATASIETGELPWSHRLFQPWGFLLHYNTQNLPASLRQLGYYTAMISSNELASPIQRRTLEGYDAVEYPTPLGALGSGRYTLLVGTDCQDTLNITSIGHLMALAGYLDVLISGDRYPFPAEKAFEQARTLVERRVHTQPLFLWTHILPPHDPYWPPASFRRRFLPTEKLISHSDPTNFDAHRLPPGVSAAQQHARYDEMIAYADHALGDFLDWLDQSGRLDRSIVIISADHGESFEHDWYNHTGPFLYNGLIHIPLLIHLPGQKQGARVSYLAQQVDLLPTILDFVGGSVPTRTDGVSLRPALEGKQLPERYVFSMNLEPNRVFDPITKGTVAVVDDEFKYVNYLGRHQEVLYRYKSDTTEEHDLIGAEPEVAKRMRDALFEKLKEVNRQFTPKP